MYYSDAGGQTSDGEDTNLAPSNRVVRAWTKTGAGEKLMGNKLNVTGSYTETNLWSISVEANDSGSPVDATFRDGFWIARGVSLNDDDDNTLEATITDLGENSSTYPVSPATYPTKLDRNLNVAYEYDAAGNVKKKTHVVDYDEGGGGTYITRYFYDDANRLEYVDYGWTDDDDVHYVYGPIGQRVAIEYGEIDLDGEVFDDFTPASARGFVCWGGNVLEEWTVSGGSLGSLVYRYVRNPATDLGGGIGSIIYQIDAAEEPRDYRYYHYNHKGDTGALTDEDGDIVAWYEYDAWGNVVTEWEASGVENEFRFSTKQWDATPSGPPDVGLIYFGARYLDTELGRWAQLDPAGTVDGVNVYVYARGNPTVAIDPHGLLVLCPLLSALCDASYDAAEESINDIDWDVTDAEDLACQLEPIMEQLTAAVANCTLALQVCAGEGLGVGAADCYMRLFDIRGLVDDLGDRVLRWLGIPIHEPVAPPPPGHYIV